jgi:multidrug efflux system membrane fusion protein
MTQRKRKHALVLGLGLAGSALALVGLGSSLSHGRTPPSKPSRPVRVERVAAEAAAFGLRYSASIQPYEQVQLAFKATGYVRELLQRRGADGRLRPVQQGDAVAAGTVLARLDAADHRQRVNQAQAQLAEAEAGLVRARADAGRAQALYDAQALTRPDLDAATSALAATLARFESARAQLESAQLALADTALVAPGSGVVLTRSIEIGSLAGAGTPGITLADLTRVKAVFGVPDLLVRRVRIDMPIPITSDAFGATEFPGRVTAVAPAADSQSRVFSVEVTIPNADGRLKPGMIGTVAVAEAGVSGIAPGSPTVPVAAIVKSARPDGYAVFVVDGPDDGAVARARDVTLGAIAGNRVAVAEGLAVGDRVVVSGASLLVDGDSLRVIPGGAEAAR